MKVLAACLLTHALLAQVIPSPWWVPDVTLVGLIVSVTRAPSRWLLFSWLAGLSMLLWSLRHAVPLMMGAVVIGGIVRLLARDWDATDARVQSLIVGLASCLMTAGAMWLDACWSLPLFGLAAVHIALTCLAFAVVRHVLVTAGVA